MFDEQGVCLPCRYIENLDKIDWQARRQEIEQIAIWARERNTSGYDCIVGVSGGKDSHRLAFYVRDELKLKPLLVCCSYPPEQQADRGAANLGNLVTHGFDLHLVSPAPQTWKKLMRHGFLRYGNWCKSTELALFTSMPRVATAFNIPLIFLGENPALAFGGDVGSLNSDANQLRRGNTLAGATLEPWIETGVPTKELYWYTFPSDQEIERLGLRMIYLGYYIRDFNDLANGKFAIEHGLEVRKGADADPNETGSINAFESVDEDFVHVNQLFKYLKLGFGKATQQLSVKVRHGEITRAEAVELVRRYDGKCSDRLIQDFCRYLDISIEEFWDTAERMRSRDLWQLNNHGDWELRYKID
jgi:N-acetyl sugar amidotransferase